jgi:asparagine synthase (glutamine-hydrolysing)
MCGIAGYLNFDKEKLSNKHLIKRMTDCMSYRGPDGEGFYINNNLALGHRRLSIIDLQTGDQPMFSDDKQKILVFNGEIYNYIELKEELKKLGHSFRTNSDTEVVIKAYEEWGYDCQNKLNGMWAFALWDNLNESLFLSKDRIGEKPLHYTIYNNAFVFASEMKSLFEYGVSKEIRPELVELYLVLTNVPAPHTFYKNIYKLMPGHFLIVKDGKIEEKKYWDLPEIDEQRMLKNKKDIYEKFEYLFKDAVKIRMRADVQFGAFLSGGLDSSSIVATMSEISEYPVKTFTIGFDEKHFDESALAQEVANKFKTEHLRGTVSPDNFEEILNKAAIHFDEPFGDSSAIPTGYVSMFAAQKVKMVLTGDGGDEVLSGYTSYQGIKLSNIIKKFPKVITRNVPRANDSLARFVKGNLRYTLNKASSIIRTSDLAFSKRIAEKTSYTDLSTIKALTKDIKDCIGIEEYLDTFMNKSTYKDDFYKLMYLNFKHDLPNDYLVKVDRMSMAYSLETRVPFLDHRLIEFMVGVDKNVKMQGWERKSVLRNTIGKKLPKNILTAPKKGFGVPIREWFKEDYFHDHVHSNLIKVSSLTNRKTIDGVFQANKSGATDNGNFIWTLMMLDKAIG